MYFCTALNISLLRSNQNDLFSCKHKSILMSALLFFGINSCMESNKTNLKLLYYIKNGRFLLMDIFGQSVLSDKKIH
jgi:hypothetical protein